MKALQIAICALLLSVSALAQVVAPAYYREKSPNSQLIAGGYLATVYVTRATDVRELVATDRNGGSRGFEFPTELGGYRVTFASALQPTPREAGMLLTDMNRFIVSVPTQWTMPANNPAYVAASWRVERQTSAGWFLWEQGNCIITNRDGSGPLEGGSLRGADWFNPVVSIPAGNFQIVNADGSSSGISPLTYTADGFLVNHIRLTGKQKLRVSIMIFGASATTSIINPPGPAILRGFVRGASGSVHVAWTAPGGERHFQYQWQQTYTFEIDAVWFEQFGARSGVNWRNVFYRLEFPQTNGMSYNFDLPFEFIEGFGGQPSYTMPGQRNGDSGPRNMPKRG